MAQAKKWFKKAGGNPIAGRVAKVEGDTVTVELVDDAAAKVGDSLRLVKARPG